MPAKHNISRRRNPSSGNEKFAHREGFVGEGASALPPFGPDRGVLLPLTDSAAHRHPHPATIEQCHIELSHKYSETLREPEGQ